MEGDSREGREDGEERIGRGMRRKIGKRMDREGNEKKGRRKDRIGGEMD